MAMFDKHLRNITNAISVEVETRSYLEKDFELIRIYLMSMLQNDSIIGPVLIENSNYQASNFNCSIVLDFSRFMPLGVVQTPYPSFIKIAQRGRNRIIGIHDLPFLGNGGNIAGGNVTHMVKCLIAQGLDFSGYFVRGHMGDIYELELMDETKNLNYSYIDCDNEWQNNYIILNATTEEITMKIRFRVLLKICASNKPAMPHPTHYLKKIWLAAADVQYMEYFSLCAPSTERELASSPSYLLAMRLLVSLIKRSKLHTLKKSHVESISYESIYSKEKAGSDKSKETVIDVLIAILQRMIEYLGKNRFPYYWNTNENLVLLLKNYANRLYTCNRLTKLLEHIREMRQNQEVSYEEIELFFGVQVNSHLYNVDDFGIYRSFIKHS
ncbi:uncharacterized protein LOC129246267 [Anastrepha obliqua]|uniref:uncharacterized protein LOC129246267 n=1 Tax=Anastrepha obliqua TaxID=95512 RepID=UPI00240989E8|nr:uncharacterized protein LOC129246267 [Anastrepha obliqua]